MVLINHSQACDSFAAAHVQKLWQLPGVNFRSLLMFLWCWQPLGTCLDHGQVQYSALSLNDTFKYWLSISWLWAFFLPKVLLHATVPPSTCGHQVSSMRRNKWNYIKNYNNACHCSWQIMLNGISTTSICIISRHWKPNVVCPSSFFSYKMQHLVMVLLTCL